MKKILLAFQFLTIIPLGNISDVSEKEIGGSTAFFPITGLLQGLLYTFSATLFLRIFTLELTNGFLIAVIVFSNGGFHIEGLSDTFDAIASRGSKEKKLSVMKDGSAGPIGVIAIVIVILLKYLLLNALFLSTSIFIYLSSLLLLPVFSRWIMVPAIFHARSARQDGLGKIFIENTGAKELYTATFLTLLMIILTVLVGNRLINMSIQPWLFSLQFLFIMLLFYVFSVSATFFCNRKFGGMTGDTFGAVSEISEILFLIMVITWSQNFI